MSEALDGSARAAVIFESLFGNTEAVARAVATGIAEYVPVDVLPAFEAPTTVDAYRLVVLGGPTHAFAMTRPQTRKSAVEQGAPGPPPTGVREWLAAARRPAQLTLAGAFDTRIRKPGLFGSAARGMRRRLGRLGFDTSPPAISFWVTGTAGPLADGELERAREWGANLARSVWTTAAVTSGG